MDRRLPRRWCRPQLRRARERRAWPAPRSVRARRPVWNVGGQEGNRRAETPGDAGRRARTVPLPANHCSQSLLTSCFSFAVRTYAVLQPLAMVRAAALSGGLHADTWMVNTVRTSTCSHLSVAARAVELKALRPTPSTAMHTPVVPVAREVVPTRPPCCLMQPS